MKSPVKFGMSLVLGLLAIALCIHFLGTSRKSGDVSSASLKVGKTESRSSLSTSSSTAASDNATFSARRVLVFTGSSHPLNQAVVARLARDLQECPLIESLVVTNLPVTFTNSVEAPDLFLGVDLLKCDRSGVVSSTMKATVIATLGNTPWQSSTHSIDASTPPLVSFHWEGTDESETTFTGIRSDRYADAAQGIADELAKSIRKQLDDLSQKYPVLPELPGEFCGPYEPVADLVGLDELEARREVSLCGLFTHNQTYWRFRTASNPVPQLERLIRRLTADGWTFHDMALTNTLAWRAHGRKGEAEVEIFRQGPMRAAFSTEGAKGANLEFVAHYRKPFSPAEREAALETLFAEGRPVEALMPFANSFSAAQRQKFFEVVESTPASSPQACVRLAENYLQRQHTNDAVRLLVRAKALGAALKDDSSLQSDIDGVARRIAPKGEGLKLEVTPAVCRELGFLELTNATSIVEASRSFDQPLVFFEAGRSGLKIHSVTVGAPLKGAYPWRVVVSEGGTRSATWSSFTPDAKGEWQHIMTAAGRRLRITANPLPEEGAVRFIVGSDD